MLSCMVSMQDLAKFKRYNYFCISNLYHYNQLHASLLLMYSFTHAHMLIFHQKFLKLFHCHSKRGILFSIFLKNFHQLHQMIYAYPYIASYLTEQQPTRQVELSIPHNKLKKKTKPSQ